MRETSTYLQIWKQAIKKVELEWRLKGMIGHNVNLDKGMEFAGKDTRIGIL